MRVSSAHVSLPITVQVAASVCSLQGNKSSGITLLLNVLLHPVEGMCTTQLPTHTQALFHVSSTFLPRHAAYAGPSPCDILTLSYLATT